MNLLELYQTERCPYCAAVRQEIEKLGLSFIAHNRNNPETRAKMLELGGKEQVPMLVDPNHDLILYESQDIIGHLRKHYAGETK